MSWETVSEEDWPEYEIFTCDECGWSCVVNGVGGDIAECPGCLTKEYDELAERGE